MLDEISITETPPLYCGYGRIGQPVCVPITGNRSKRIIQGALNIRSGDLLLLITEVWDEVTHQYFLGMIRFHWRGWHIIVFEDRGSPPGWASRFACCRELVPSSMPWTICFVSSTAEEDRIGRPKRLMMQRWRLVRLCTP